MSHIPGDRVSHPMKVPPGGGMDALENVFTAKGLGYISGRSGNPPDTNPYNEGVWCPDSVMWLRGYTLGQRDWVKA